MDRIDIVVDVWRSDPAHVLNTGMGISSAQLRQGVMQARAFADWRRARDQARGLTNDSSFIQGEKEQACGYAGWHADSRAGSNEVGHTARPIGPGAALLASCHLGIKERSSLEIMAERYQLSGRGIMCALSVARTIADMEESERVLQEHLLEAVSFRKNDRESAEA